MTTEHLDNWEEMPEDQLTGNGYRNIHRGWEHTEHIMNNEVLIYHVEGTDVEDTTDKPVAVQHLLDESGENTHFFDSLDTAVTYATTFMQEHPELPVNTEHGEPNDGDGDTVAHQVAIVEQTIVGTTDSGDPSVVDIKLSSGAERIHPDVAERLREHHGVTDLHTFGVYTADL